MAKIPVILTLDIGLTNCKAALFDTRGGLAAQVSLPYQTFQPRPGWSEQDPLEWWAVIVRAVHELLSEPQQDKYEILAISPTAHMHALTTLDGNGQPVTPCLTLFDIRALAEAREIQATLGPGTAFRITGARLEAYTPAAKICWLQNNEPERARKVAQYLSPKDALRVFLGGDPVTDPVDAAGMLLVDLARGDWSPDMVAAAGINRNQLPEIRPPAAAGGTLSSAAGALLGLPAGLPLVVGCGDDVEAYGAGVLFPGQAMEHIGTTGTLIACLEVPVFDPNEVVEVYPHVIPGSYLIGGATNAAGRSFDWARRLLALPGGRQEMLHLEPLEQLDALEPPVYLPYICGERGLLWEPEASGALVGLREAHTPRQVAVGVYRGVAYSLKEFIVAFEDLGVPLTQIISGEGNKNPLWSQLRADIYNCPIYFPASDYLTGLGAAMLGLVQQGVYSGYEAAAQACCTQAIQVVPDQGVQAIYRRDFERYRLAVSALRSSFARL